MAYVALYRAYRPQKFSEVVGQQHIIKTLQNAIKMNKVAHAYLFCGPRGTGKTTLAKIMAKALNCVNGPTVEPCDECEICQGIQKGIVPDVIEIDAASNNGADDIRALRDSVKYLPAVGKYKVYIIDEVHMLSNAAFNALLKTLEEPPKHVIFILATTEPYKLPNTILSRCQRFDFQAISIEDLIRRLKIVTQSENIHITDEAINQIASSAEGGMRDALSLLDQTVSYSVNQVITIDDVLAVSGNVSYLQLIKLLDHCLDGYSTEALKDVDIILKQGKEVPRVINDLIIFLRDVLLFKNNAVLDDRLEFHQNEFIKFCSSIGKNIIYEWLNELNEANNNMRYSNQKRAYLELAILKLSDAKVNESYSLLDRIESLEHTIQMLSVPETSKKEEQPIEINIPTKEEIQEIKNIEVKKEDSIQPKPVEILKSDEIQIEEVEAILNTASKARKAELQQIMRQIGRDYPDIFIAQILVAGEIVAVNDNQFITVLSDLGFSNRLMKYENYQRIMEIFANYDSSIDDYICLPKAVWNKIRADYAAKYNPTNSAPVKLEKIKIGVLRRKEPTIKETTLEEEKLNFIKEYIDENKLEIVEE